MVQKVLLMVLSELLHPPWFTSITGLGSSEGAEMITVLALPFKWALAFSIAVCLW